MTFTDCTDPVNADALDGSAIEPQITAHNELEKIGGESGSLLADLEARQDEVIAKLDELNERVLAVLREAGVTDSGIDPGISNGLDATANPSADAKEAVEATDPQMSKDIRDPEGGEDDAASDLRHAA